VISIGTLAGALIPEFTKIFTSMNSRHVKEIVTCSKQAAPRSTSFRLRLRQLLGVLAGLVILGLMFAAYFFSQHAAFLRADA